LALAAPLIRTAVLVALALLALAGRAQANPGQESIFQDDRVLTFEGGVVQGQALDALKALGVNTIHTVVNWRRLAPGSGSKKPPKGFNGANPAAYPEQAWAPFDDLVAGATARGMTVLMSPAGPIPRWASRCKRNTNNDCRPNPKLYGDFVAALGTRYSGGYRDSRRPDLAIPRVARWSIWNEPNLSSWLSPQSSGPLIYRSLVYAGVGALRRSGHGRDQILAGETAPIGSGKNTAPVKFWQVLLCVGVHGRQAKATGCSKRKRLPVTGVSHHPYTRGAGKPLLSKQTSGSVTIRYLSRLDHVLAQGARNHMIRRHPPIYLTEFGVTSTPPARKLGVPISLQGAYLNQYEYLAYRHPSVAGVSQFQLEDDTGLAGKGTFQTGLLFGDGTPKPTIDAYRTPLYVVTSGKRNVIVFGGSRPPGAPRRIAIQNRPSQSAAFQTVATVTSNARGYVYVKLPARSGTWRLAWTSSGFAFFSRETFAAKPGKSPPGSPRIYDFAPQPLPQAQGGPQPGTPPPGGPLATSPPSGTAGSGTPPPPPPKLGLQVTFQRNGIPLPGSPSPGGTVTSSPAGINCTDTCSANFSPGTVITLTAQADQSSFFQGWSGGGCGGNGPCALTLNQATNVTATFGSTPF
jgi:hypothetical protein